MPPGGKGFPPESENRMNSSWLVMDNRSTLISSGPRPRLVMAMVCGDDCGRSVLRAPKSIPVTFAATVLSTNAPNRSPVNEKLPGGSAAAALRLKLARLGPSPRGRKTTWIHRTAPGAKLVCPVSERIGNSATSVPSNCAVSPSRLVAPVLVIPIDIGADSGASAQVTPKSTCGVKLIGGCKTSTETACVALIGGWPLSRTTGWRTFGPTWESSGVQVTSPFVGLMVAPGTLAARLNVKKLVGMSRSCALLVKRSKPPA